jgi:nucleotide-binding universal stress UspA family protein
MKKILVATDFSACASNAMEYALDLAKTLNVGVHAIHAIGSFEGLFNNTYNALYIDDYYNSKRQALQNWAATYTAQAGYSAVTVTTSADVGSVSGVIGKYIETNPVEMLLMGTTGTSGVAGLFGSNASSMVEKTKIPTLIIPLGSKFSVNPVITLATDFSSTPLADDITALNELVKAFGSPKMNVVNIVEGAAWKTNEKGEETLKALLPHTTLEFKYLKEDGPIEGIMNFIASSQTDIVCLVKRHHGLVYRLFNTSTVNKVLSKSIKAILVLHE